MKHNPLKVRNIAPPSKQKQQVITIVPYFFACNCNYFLGGILKHFYSTFTRHLYICLWFLVSSAKKLQSLGQDRARPRALDPHHGICGRGHGLARRKVVSLLGKKGARTAAWWVFSWGFWFSFFFGWMLSAKHSFHSLCIIFITPN